MVHKADPGISFINVIPQGVEDLVNLGQNFIFSGKKRKGKTMLNILLALKILV